MTAEFTPKIVCARSCCALIAGLWTSPAAAQNWSFDARRVALGGIGTTENVASGMVEEQRRYRSIVLPLGLIPVLSDLDVFKPGGDRFDPVRAMEYAASPLHYTIGRNSNERRLYVRRRPRQRRD